MTPDNPTEAQGDWVLVPRTDLQTLNRRLSPGTRTFDDMISDTGIACDLVRVHLAAPSSPLLADLVAACLEWARADASDKWARAGYGEIVGRRDDAARALGRALLAQEGKGR